MKPNIDFEYIANDLAEGKALNKFRKNNPSTDTPAVKKWIAFCTGMSFLGMIVFGGAVAILLVQFQAPVWINTCAIFGLIGVLLFMWAASFDKSMGK